MVDGVNQQPGLFQRIGNFFGTDDPNAGQPTDPFAGLSRSQRTMLGFAALRDAAGALEGRDTNFFQSALGGFEQARERERLRAQGQMQNQVQALQALAQIQALNQISGGNPATQQLEAALMAQLGMDGGMVMPAGGAAAPMAAPAPSVAAPSVAAPAVRPATGPNIMDAQGNVVGYIDDQGREVMLPAGGAPVEPAAPVDEMAALDQREAEIIAEIERLSRASSVAGVTAPTRGLELELARIGDQRERLAAEQQAAATAAEEAAAAQSRLETRTPQVVNTLETTQDLREMIEANPGRTTGLVGSVLQNVPGTMANDARALGLRIRANLGFDQLQAMREASPTGGALGQVAVQELDALQSTIGNLDLTQTPGQILDQIADIENNYMRLIRRAYETSEDVEALDRALGGRPAFMVEGGGASAPLPSGAATHRYNPATGQIEAIR